MPPELDTTLAALADPCRRRVIDLLAKGPCPAGALARATRSTPPAMSRHLRVLRRCGLVDEQRDDSDARVRIYRLRRRPLANLQDWLRQVESFWSDQLDAFKTHAEREARRPARPRGAPSRAARSRATRRQHSAARPKRRRRNGES